MCHGLLSFFLWSFHDISKALMHVCVLCVYARTHAHTYVYNSGALPLCKGHEKYVCIGMYVCMHVCVYVCMHVPSAESGWLLDKHTYTHRYIHTSIRVYMYMYIYIYIYIYTYTHTYIQATQYTQTYIRTSIVIHTYIHTSVLMHACRVISA